MPIIRADRAYALARSLELGRTTGGQDAVGMRGDVTIHRADPTASAAANRQAIQDTIDGAEANSRVTLPGRAAAYQIDAPIRVDKPLTLDMTQARLQASVAMSALVEIRNPGGTIEQPRILGGRFECNNLANYAIEDFGSRSTILFGARFDDAVIAGLHCQPRDGGVDSNFWTIMNCMSIDCPQFAFFRAGTDGRPTDFYLNTIRVIRPTGWALRIQDCSRFRGQNIFAGNRQAEWAGVFLIRAEWSQSGSPNDPDYHHIQDVHMEADAGFTNFPVGVRVETDNSPGEFQRYHTFENIEGNLQTQMRAVVLGQPTNTGGTRDMTVVLNGPDGGPTDLVDIAPGCVWTRVIGRGFEGGLHGHVKDNGSNTIINNYFREAAGVGNPPTTGDTGLIIHNTDDDTFWVRDLAGSFHQIA